MDIGMATMVDSRPAISRPGRAIPVLIVTFRNPSDPCRCLRALARLDRLAPFQVFVCENGGAAAYDALIAALVAEAGVSPDPDPDLGQEWGDALPAPRFDRMVRLRLHGADNAFVAAVHVGQASENLGYAGGVNAYLRPLDADQEWPGAWILNPDTEPAPNALRELVDYAADRGCGMVGSRIVTQTAVGATQMSGLAWRRWRCATATVGAMPATDAEPTRAAIDLIEARLDAPSGASLYVTRACLRQTGLMDERYFLYCEDLEWGVRAKRQGRIGYAHRSVVVHEQGTTTGSAWLRNAQSKLTTYLDCRNRVTFVRRNRPAWLPVMVVIELLEVANAIRRGAFETARTAARGLLAGLRGEVGRPASILRAHTGDAATGYGDERRSAKRYVKLLITVLMWPVLTLWRAAAQTVGFGRRKLTVLYYHGVSAENTASFARQMRQLARWAHVVPADWDGGAVPGSRPIVAITFDDAFDSVLDNALPILASHGFPCTIFVPTGHLGEKPSWTMDRPVDQTERVASGERLAGLPPELVTIGSHSENHRHLTALSSDEELSELERSRSKLSGMLGRDVRLFAFPYGDFDAAAIEACRVAGYRRAFTIEPLPVDDAYKSFIRGRIGVEPYDGTLEFYCKATGSYRWMATVSSARRRWRAFRGLPVRR